MIADLLQRLHRWLPELECGEGCYGVCHAPLAPGLRVGLWRSWDGDWTVQFSRTWPGLSYSSGASDPNLWFAIREAVRWYGQRPWLDYRERWSR